MAQGNKESSIATLGRSLAVGGQVEGAQPSKAADKPSAGQRLPGILGASNFQGKCAVLYDAFFPVIVSAPSPIPKNWLPATSVDFSNTYTLVTETKIAKAIRSCNMDSACDQDNVPYRIINASYEAVPGQLGSLISNLLQYGPFRLS